MGSGPSSRSAWERRPPRPYGESNTFGTPERDRREDSVARPKGHRRLRTSTLFMSFGRTLPPPPPTKGGKAEGMRLSTKKVFPRRRQDGRAEQPVRFPGSGRPHHLRRINQRCTAPGTRSSHPTRRTAQTGSWMYGRTALFLDFWWRDLGPKPAGSSGPGEPAAKDSLRLGAWKTGGDRGCMGMLDNGPEAGFLSWVQRRT